MSILIQYPPDMRKKRGPKTKVYNGPLPEHLKLLAELCIKHDGPGNLTYWDRIFEEAEQLSEELFIMIKERRAKYPTFKKSRLRFLVDRQYRMAFNDYRTNCELAMGRHPSPSSVIQVQKVAVTKASSVSRSSVIQSPLSDDACDNFPSHLKRFAVAIAQSELGSGGEACYECLRRYTPEAKDFDKLDSETKQAVLRFKDTTKESLRNKVIPPYQFDYKFTIDGMQHFQNFMAKNNEHISLYNKEERSLPEVFKEFAFHLSRANLYRTVYMNEWLFLHRQPMCMALRTLLQKDRKVLVHCRNKESFKSYLSKIHPLVKQMEQGRMNVVTCGSCAGNLRMEKASQRDDAASALLTLAHSDSSSYTSDGSSA
jgi:hypothetical protein